MIGKNNRLYTGPDAEWERRVRESMEAGKEWAFKVPSHAYDDIIHLPHHVSSVHPPMSLHDRAAQFSPFAALSGFEGEIRETERLTEGKIELDEEEAGRLDERLRQIRQHLSVCPRVSLTWFCRMRERTEAPMKGLPEGLKKLDPVQGLLVFTDGRKIPLEQIVWIEEETGISDF